MTRRCSVIRQTLWLAAGEEAAAAGVEVALAAAVEDPMAAAVKDTTKNGKKKKNTRKALAAAEDTGAEDTAVDTAVNHGEEKECSYITLFYC